MAIYDNILEINDTAELVLKFKMLIRDRYVLI